MNLLHISAAAAAACLLAACGGSDPGLPDAPPVATEVPASARATTLAWTQFAATLPASDSAEPLTMGTEPAPTSETDEPIAVN